MSRTCPYALFALQENVGNEQNFVNKMQTPATDFPLPFSSLRSDCLSSSFKFTTFVFLPPSSLQPSYQYFDVTLYIMSYLQITVWRWMKRCSTVGTICKWALRCNFSFLQLCKWKAKNAFSNAFIHILSS